MGCCQVNRSSVREDQSPPAAKRRKQNDGSAVDAPSVNTMQQPAARPAASAPAPAMAGMPSSAANSKVLTDARTSAQTLSHGASRDKCEASLPCEGPTVASKGSPHSPPPEGAFTTAQVNGKQRQSPEPTEPKVNDVEPRKFQPSASEGVVQTAPVPVAADEAVPQGLQAERASKILPVAPAAGITAEKKTEPPELVVAEKKTERPAPASTSPTNAVADAAMAEQGHDSNTETPAQGLPVNGRPALGAPPPRPPHSSAAVKAAESGRDGQEAAAPQAMLRGNAGARSSTAPATRNRRVATPSAATDPHPSLPPEAASGRLASGEVWSDFVQRTSGRLDPTKMEPAALFETFRTSSDLGIIYACFAQLFHLSTGGSSGSVPPWSSEGHAWAFPYEPIRVLLGGHWKAKQLWEKLDKRRSRSDLSDVQCNSGPLRGRRAVVVGAGPAGLYIAVHLRLLGTPVTVVERRENFSRINQLHLWSWCGEEIKALGARSLEPPPQDFGSNPDLLSIGISDLQTLLFKTALLLGAEILLGADFKKADWKDGWQVHLGKRAQLTESCKQPLEEVSPKAPEFVSNVGVLIGTDGSDCTVGKFFGIETVELGNLRAEDAIGLVCNFTRVPSSDKPLRSFALARQFYGPLFQQLADQTGCELENIVYTKSSGSHYFVTTPTRRSLHKTGVLLDLAHKPLLAQNNVDRNALDTYIRHFVSFPFKVDQVPLAKALADSLQYADKGPQLFDFSKLRRANSGLLFASPPNDQAPGDGGQLLVALAGDALLEPFWPEGLGIVRGFLSSLDVTHAVTEWAAGQPTTLVEQHFAEAFSQLKTLGARTRGSVLRDDEKLFGLAPSSRYKGLKSTAP